MAPQVLYRVCFGTPNPPPFQRSSITITPALLLAYTCHKVRLCDYPAIIPSSSTSSVHGTYVSGLTDGDIWRLDIFEGGQYVRKKLKIRTLTKVGDGTGEGNVEGEEVEVETYVWIAGDELLEEGEWDFDEFKREKLKSWVGSEQYEGEVNTNKSILGILIGQTRGVVDALTTLQKSMRQLKLESLIQQVGGERRARSRTNWTRQ